ncbi:MAG: glycosyltransferase [Bacteroidales bacterium]|nr:glycosyltransferase [Bacteroidales bacterium]
MTDVLLVGAADGNGGIRSWTNRFLNDFPDDEFRVFLAPISYRRCKSTSTALVHRIVDGLLDLRYVYNNTKRAIKSNHIRICHIATSGSIGSLRDIVLARLCRRHGIKTIMHCHYGCLIDDFKSHGVVGWLLKRSISLCDQIWVLDSKSFAFLQKIDEYKDKVFLTPNFIDVNVSEDTIPNDFKRVLYVGNLIPTKGIYELASAVMNCDVRLDLIGPGEDVVIQHLKTIVGEQLGKRVFIHGKLPNAEAICFMRNVDIIALPTYYPWEAFPISILEAMSLSKMVISCHRAAIPDMLTDLHGNRCGILVAEKSADEIEKAIKWCQQFKSQAIKMCHEAFLKVDSSYRTDIVFETYRRNYRELL